MAGVHGAPIAAGQRAPEPEGSVLIVTIDEKEDFRLGLLLDQTFPGVRTQMVSSVINPAGTGRKAEFSGRTSICSFFSSRKRRRNPTHALGDGKTSPCQSNGSRFERRDLEKTAARGHVGKAGEQTVLIRCT